VAEKRAILAKRGREDWGKEFEEKAKKEMI